MFSDIHGNVAALDAVLADAAARQVDLMVNLGDICSGGLFPRETADRLIPLTLPSGSPHARYAIVSDDQGHWSAELLRVTYDWEQAASDASANGRDDWASALRTGRV